MEDNYVKKYSYTLDYGCIIAISTSHKVDIAVLFGVSCMMKFST